MPFGGSLPEDCENRTPLNFSSSGGGMCVCALACCELVFWSLEFLEETIELEETRAAIFVMAGQKESLEIVLDTCYDILA